MNLSGVSIDVYLGPKIVHFKTVSLNIDDGAQAAQTKGLPDGSLLGALGAGGEVVVTTKTLKQIIDLIPADGSFQELEPFDIVFTATLAGETFKVEAFDCKLKISDLLNADGNSGDQLTHTLPYFVSGQDFVHIDGKPYARRLQQ